MKLVLDEILLWSFLLQSACRKEHAQHSSCVTLFHIYIAGDSGLEISNLVVSKTWVEEGAKDTAKVKNMIKLVSEKKDGESIVAIIAVVVRATQTDSSANISFNIVHHSTNNCFFSNFEVCAGIFNQSMFWMHQWIMKNKWQSEEWEIPILESMFNFHHWAVLTQSLWCKNERHNGLIKRIQFHWKNSTQTVEQHTACHHCLRKPHLIFNPFKFWLAPSSLLLSLSPHLARIHVPQSRIEQDSIFVAAKWTNINGNFILFVALSRSTGSLPQNKWCHSNEFILVFCS